MKLVILQTPPLSKQEGSTYWSAADKWKSTVRVCAAFALCHMLSQKCYFNVLWQGNQLHLLIFASPKTWKKKSEQAE